MMAWGDVGDDDRLIDEAIAIELSNRDGPFPPVLCTPADAAFVAADCVANSSHLDASSRDVGTSSSSFGAYGLAVAFGLDDDLDPSDAARWAHDHHASQASRASSPDEPVDFAQEPVDFAQEPKRATSPDEPPDLARSALAARLGAAWSPPAAAFPPPAVDVALDAQVYVCVKLTGLISAIDAYSGLKLDRASLAALAAVTPPLGPALVATHARALVRRLVKRARHARLPSAPPLDFSAYIPWRSGSRAKQQAWRARRHVVARYVNWHVCELAGQLVAAQRSDRHQPKAAQL